MASRFTPSEVVKVMHCKQRTGTTSGPPCMKNHTATLFRNELIVFGGFDGNTNNSRVYVMNVDTGDWRIVEQVEGVAPAGRNGHTATLANDKIFYIGGWLGSGPLGSGDVHTLDPVTWTWSRLLTYGTGPGPCNMHTADFIELSTHERYIFLFRGGDGQSYLNDLHLLDVDRLVWKRPQTKGRAPAPRANHSSAVINQKLVVFGGWDGQSRLDDLHILDATTMTWSCPEIHGILPTPRAGSTLTCVGNGLILFGGSGPHSSCYNDFHFFDIEKMTWHKAQEDKDSSTQHSEELDLKRARVSERRRDDNPNIGGNSLNFASNYRIQGINPGPFRDIKRLIRPANTPNTEKRAGHTATLVNNRRILIVGGSCQTEYLKTVVELDIDPLPDLDMALTTAGPSESLIKSLSSFFNSQEFSDVVFKVESERIYCHRIVLCAQSDWFKVLFQRGFHEAQEKEIPVQNVSARVFKQMIEFFYMGDLALLSGNLSSSMPGASSESSRQLEASPGLPGVEYASAPQEGLVEDEIVTMGGISHGQPATLDDEEARVGAICELLVVADQFICDHLKERCEVALARLVNGKTFKILMPFARANGTPTLLRCCEHFERWGTGQSFSTSQSDFTKKFVSSSSTSRPSLEVQNSRSRRVKKSE